MAKSISSNFAFNALFQVTRIITPIITIPYLSRILGPEGVGIYSYTNSITYYFTLVAVMGMSLYGVRLIATHSSNRMELSKAFWSAYSAQILMGTLITGVYVAYALSPLQSYGIITWIWLMWVVSAVLDISWLYFGLEEFKMPTMRSMLLKVIEIAAIFLFVRSADDLWLYVAISSGEYLVNSLVLWPWTRRYVDFYRPSWQEVRHHIRPSLALFVPVIAVSLYTSMDKILIGALSDMTQAGYFEYSEKINRLLTALLTALGTVILPRMSSIIARGDMKHGKRLIGNMVWVMLVGAMALMFGTIGIAPVLVPVFFGNEFIPCVELISLLSVMIPIICLSNVVGKQYLLPSFRDKQYTVSVCGGAIINITVNVVLIPFLGALGAVVGSLVAELTVLVMQLHYIKGELPIASYIRGVVPFVAIGIIEMLSIRWSSSIFAGLDGAPLLVLEFFVGVISYSALALLWCIFTHNENFEIVYRRMAKKFTSRRNGED